MTENNNTIILRENSVERVVSKEELDNISKDPNIKVSQIDENKFVKLDKFYG